MKKFLFLMTSVVSDSDFAIKLMSVIAASVLVTSTGATAAVHADDHDPINSFVFTSGELNTFASGIERGYDISGYARMIRTPDNKTFVYIEAYGLMADTTYPTHVHNKACNDSNGGGHYQHEIGGPVDSINEIWLTFTTNIEGIGKGFAKNDFYSRPEAQSIVVHDTDLARIACVDLE